MINQIINGDCLEVMAEIPDKSIDLVVTSPPYNRRDTESLTKRKTRKSKGGKWGDNLVQRGYSCHDDVVSHDEYVSWQRNVLSELMRLLKDDGAIFYNHKWRVQRGLMQDRNDIVSSFPVRQIIIWQRAGGFNFNPGYFLPTYEVIYLIAKPKFKLAPQKNAYGDIWFFPQEQNNNHPAPFPVALPYRCIESTDAKIILDPFMGSGTTALAAQRLGRKFIGIEKSLAYCEQAKERLGINDFQEEVIKPVREVEFKQLSLFDIA